jgi:hypothetical protein
VSTRCGEQNRKRANSIGTAAHQSSHERPSSSVTALALEQVLAELGVHARLSDIVRGAQLMETAIMQFRSPRKPEHAC